MRSAAVALCLAFALEAKTIKIQLPKNKSVIVDCEKLSDDKKPTVDFLRQLDPYPHSWKVIPPEKQRDEKELRFQFQHILNYGDLWTVGKVKAVINVCGGSADNLNPAPRFDQ